MDQVANAYNDVPIEGDKTAGDYRDIVVQKDHGTSDFSQATNYDLTMPVRDKVKGAADAYDFVPEPEEISIDSGEAVAVTRTMETASRGYNAFTVYALPGTSAYPGDPALLVGEDASRSRVIISNTHETQGLVIGPLEQINSGSGFTLPPFNVVEMFIQGAIYACVPLAATDPIGVGVLVERN